MKPGQTIDSLAPETGGRVLLHPAQQEMVLRIAILISRLRSCCDTADLCEFQRLLFGELYSVEQRRAECSRVIKRLRSGQTVPADLSKQPHYTDKPPLENWTFEAYVFERLARQLRSVGDALAWRCFGYDRRPILTLSRNQSAGPMFGKEGLPYELGRVEDLWKTKGHFGLLHDLTNSLRMGDISEFTSDGTVLLHEVKATPHTEMAQVRRLEAAIGAINDGGPLPGGRSSARLVRLSERYRTHLRSLNDLLQLSKEHGCRGMKLLPGRAVTATCIPRLCELWSGDPKGGRAAVEAGRQGAIKRARMREAIHHIRGVSGDSASRFPTAPPWPIYPFSPADCSALTCDSLIFDTVLDPNALVVELAGLGLTAQVNVPRSNGPLPEEGDVVTVRLGNRGLVLHNPGLAPLLFELMDIGSWARGVRELLQREEAPGEPALIFSGEAEIWD